ncbi:MAG: hypothetical protein PVJ02_14310 [Gemmatimonadota bacterium]|jgi:hypothetical protein
MTDEREFLTEEEAHRLWERAAQLQAEAARRAEARAASHAEEELSEDAWSRPDGYALTHVRAAALEAGIGEDFLEAALAEVHADRATRLASPGKRRFSRWLLGRPSDSVTARRIVQASPREILKAMERILPEEPYALTLRERLGDPESGGTLVFDMQGVGFTSQGQPGFKGDASQADLRSVYVTLAPLPGDPPRTEVTLRSPVAWAFRLNAGLSGGLSILGGGITLLLAGAVGSSMAFLGPVGFGLLVATGGTAGGLATLTGMRTLYRYGLRRGARALDGLLANVAATAQGGWGIAAGSEKGAEPTAP